MIVNANGNKLSSSRYQSGVTLIELLVVLAVLAVFVSLGIPSFNSVFDRHRVTGAAQSLYADLQYARSESIKRNLEVAVNFNAGAWCYGLTDTAPYADCDCGTASAASCTINGQQYTVSNDRFPGVSMVSSSGSVSFDPTRGTLSSSSDISFTGDAAEQVRVEARLVGRVRLCSPTEYAGYKSC